MKIEFLYWEDCPSYPNAFGKLKGLMSDLKITDEVIRIEVNTDEEAREHAFPGSPTIRINGDDIDPGGANEQRVGLSCRIYHDADGRITPVPPDALIRKALEKALRKEAGP
jgi:hypothetical protein